MHEHNLPMQ